MHCPRESQYSRLWSIFGIRIVDEMVLLEKLYEFTVEWNEY